MRVVIDLVTNEILQTEKIPEVGESKPINGKYVFDLPNVNIPIDSTSYVLPKDGGDIYSLAFEELRKKFGYGYYHFNSLISGTDFSEIDLNANIINNPFLTSYTLESRCQTGASTGTFPLMTALLPRNAHVTPTKPGCLITDTIDISTEFPSGTDKFVVYCKIYKINVSHDINSNFGLSAGKNEPAIKYLEEVDQELSDFSVAISVDDGVNYEFCTSLTPVITSNLGNQIRLAFFNTGYTGSVTDKIYLANYAILY